MRLRHQLISIVVHIALVSALWWRPWAPLALAFGWIFAWLSFQEPTRTTSPRHFDVAAFEKTPLGRALKYRAGWMPSSFPRWGGPVLALLLFGPGLAWGLVGPVGEPYSPLWWRHVVATTLTSPVAVLGLGAVLANILIQPVILPFFALGYVVAVIGAATRGLGVALLVLAAAIPPALIVYATDLARLLRRRLEGPRPPRDGPKA